MSHALECNNVCNCGAGPEGRDFVVRAGHVGCVCAVMSGEAVQWRWKRGCAGLNHRYYTSRNVPQGIISMFESSCLVVHAWSPAMSLGHPVPEFFPLQEPVHYNSWESVSIPIEKYLATPLQWTSTMTVERY